MEDIIENEDEFEIKFDHIYKKLRRKVVNELADINKEYIAGKKDRGIAG